MKRDALKILHITKWFPSPHNPQLGVFVEKHILASQHHCTVHILHLSPTPSPEIAVVDYKNNGTNITRIEFPEDKNALFKLCVLSKIIQKTCSTIVEKWGYPDLIHAHLLAQPVLIAKKNFPNTPIICSEHWTGFVNGYFEQLPLWKRQLFKKAVGWSHTITTPSTSLQMAMTQVHKFKGNFQVVPNVIESYESDSAQRTNDEFTFLTVADLHDYNKNISGALRVFSAINKNFKYEIIGDGADQESLKKLCCELGLNERVSFLGRKNNQEVLKHLHTVDALLVNSNFETFSMITAESLAAGIPVIATRCGGPEQFVHHKNGLLIERENDEALKHAIHHMLEHGREYDKKSIREEFKDKFSSLAIGKRLYNIYQSALVKSS